MGSRIFSTLLLWAIVAGCVIFLGPIGAVWLIALIAVLTQWEFFKLIQRLGLKPFNRIGMLFGAALCLGPLYLEPHGLSSGPLLALAAIVFAVRILGERDAENRMESLAWTLFGIVYIPFMLSFLGRIVLINDPVAHTGLILGVWVIAVSKFCDVGALLAGLAFGRHKMAPGISPKKTWEGAVGGLLTSMGVGAGLAYGFADQLPALFTPLLAGLLALPVAALAIVSDLVESVIKRRTNAKDAGATIPGIGGVFDLSDSLILTAPIGYLVFRLL
ncbi:phosphatidate cytidylyltransferase [Synoicihabitans lomoniglobus]|uniref:Phosphatidate cytidylyltransferase n=1 Tax=Synoicihabitans lomoniglobus TaxID=2909285 RepID=A0AAE9ZVE5_9BACT|nr:phosphatidate cytidylyltransferase [Opitutaceae bacterium LMO-M01]WED63535.1 phosphatidate cytidylyltransferase [Opitutaceae bacterium LMO-M01]